MALKKKFKIQYFQEGLEIIIKYLKPHKRAVFILTILSVISAVVGGIIPYIVGRFFDALIALNLELSLYLIGVWFLISITGDIIDWRIDLWRARIGVLLDNEYLTKGFGHLFRLPIAFHKTRKIGDVGDRIGKAASALDGIVQRVVINLAPQFLSIIVALAISFYINYLLALILVFAVLFYIFILAYVTPKTVGLHTKMRRAYNLAYGGAYGSIENIQTIKQASSEDYEQRKIWYNFTDKAGKYWIELIKLENQLSFSQRTLIVLTRASIFLISIFLVANKELTVGQLIMFNGYAALLFGPFVILGRNWQVIQNGIVALKRGEKVLEERPEQYNPKEAVILRGVQGQIEFKNVSFKYEKSQKEILENISFKAPAGTKIALVGESGVGKTTLVDLISLYYKLTKGEIFIDGYNITRVDLHSLRSQIAVVPQEPVLFDDTIKYNIRYGSFRAGQEEVEEAAKKAHIHEFIETLPKKYNQVVGWRGIKLSTGQKQRIAIARAILRNPKILILDEPTSALDAKTEKQLQESFAYLMEGKTTFIIAHRLSTVRQADIILVLDKGKITEQGSHEELLKIKNGIYKNIYELQIGLI